MKNQKFLTNIVFFLLFSAIAFGQTADVQVGCKPLSVKFTAPTTSSTYYWDFKNGVTSTLEKPEVTFSTEGTYEVEYRETMEGPIIGTIKINVIEKFEVGISAVPEKACVGESIAFVDTTHYPTEITSIIASWDFGDGKTKKGDNVTHAYSSDGTYNISLSIKTDLSNCDATKIFKDFILIDKSPTPLFVTDPVLTNTCDSPLNVSFTNKTPNLNANTYEWDMGNSNKYATTNPQDQTYSEGTYSVKLTATSPVGCSASATKSIIVGAPVADFLIPDSVCINTPVQVINKTIGFGDLLWDFGSDASPSTSHKPNLFVTFSKGGMIPVKLTATSPDGKCSSDTTITIFVDDPDATFTRDPTFSCETVTPITFTPVTQDAKKYEWTFGNNTSSMDVNPTVIYDESDYIEYTEHKLHPYVTTLSMTSKLGCKAVSSVVDTIFRPYAHFEMDTSKGCAPLEVTFSDLSTSFSDLVSWEYDFGDSQNATLNMTDSIKHIYTDPGDYDVWLQVENQKGCRDTSFHMTVHVGDLQNVSFAIDTSTICIGESIHFEGNSLDPDPTEWHFDTDNGRSSHCYPDSIMDWTFQSETGTFDVELWAEYNGCFTTQLEEDMITVKGPLAKIDYLIDCDNPNDVAFRDSSEQADNVIWYFGDGDSSLVSNVVHHYDAVGDYQVILKAEGTTGCGPSFDTSLVCVRNIESVITLDKKVCYGETYMLDGTASKGVDNRCHRGYTWYFQKNSRPITTDDDMKEFQFGVKGVDTLALEVRDINGCMDTSYHAVKVFKIEPDFTMDKSKICIPSDVAFESISTADTTLISNKWDFGDSETSILLSHSSPTHSYITPVDGTITVKLTAKDIVGCEASTTKEIDVYQPQSKIIPVSSVICEGETVSFAATDFTEEGSHLSYSWSSNGQTSTKQSPSFEYLTEGDFPVTLDFEEVSTGCSGQVIGNVTVQGIPEAAITIVGNENFCVSGGAKQLFFKNGSMSNFPLSTNWDLGNEVIAKGDDVATTYLRGTYNVKLVVSTSAGCKDSTTIPVTIVGPVGEFEVDKDSICLGETITFSLKDTLDIGTYTWEFGDGSTLKEVDPVEHIYQEFLGGQTVVKLVFSDVAGECTDSREKTIYIRDVRANFDRGLGDTDIEICEGLSIQFKSTSTGSDVFEWDFGDGEKGVGNTASHIFNTPGALDVTLHVENAEFGCTDDITKPVIVNPKPDIVAFGDTICKGYSATLQVINPNNNEFSYIWSSFDGLVFDTEMGDKVQTDTINTAGTYKNKVEVTNNDSGCNNEAFVNVVVLDGIMDYSLDSIIYTPDVVTINTPVHGYNFSWAQVDSSGVSVPLSCYDCATPQFTTPSGVDSLVFVATVNGKNCDSVKWRFVYHIIDVENPRYVKVFTPNGDGKNDYFHPIFNSKETEEFAVITDMRIFNRWGQLVYDNDTPDQGWDGTFKGKPQSQDVYLYIVSGYFPGKEDHPFTHRGDITLLR